MLSWTGPLGYHLPKLGGNMGVEQYSCSTLVFMKACLAVPVFWWENLPPHVSPPSRWVTLSKWLQAKKTLGGKPLNLQKEGAHHMAINFTVQVLIM